MNCGVYMIRNVYTKRAYIGSSVNMPERWKQHRRALQRGDHHSPALQAAWRKYGATAFEFVVLELARNDSLLESEQHWLRLCSSDLNGTRDVKGGRRRTGNQPEARQRISVAIKNKWADPAFRAKATAGMKGSKRGGATITVFGRTATITALAVEYKLSPQLLRYRLRSGLTPEKALTDPVESRAKR